MRDLSRVAGPLRVVPEASRRDRRTFLDLPYRLYAGHPVWVPPLRRAERAFADRRSNPFFAHAEVQHFLALRGRRPVGRIAAIHNRLHNETHGDRLGFFGFFDVEPDPEAAAALVAAARTWTRARGLVPLRGPVNYSTNDTCGVLVEGFEHPPAILMPYNRPDYDALLRGAGLVAAKDLVAFWIPSGLRAPERFRRVVARGLERSGIRMRSVDLAHLADEVQRVKEVYNRCWADNWGFVPATEAEFEHAAKDLEALLDPDLSAVAEIGGQMVGLCLVLRDVNVLLRGLDGRLLPFGWLRLWRGLARVRRMRIIALGVVPEARGRGVNEALFLNVIDRAALRDIEGAEAGWILADNLRMQAPILHIGGRPWKRYRIYETPA